MAGNAVRLAFPAPPQSGPGPEPEPELPDDSPRVAGYVSGSVIVLNWQAVNDPKFKYYKIVISRNNPDPVYPQDGYLYFFSDKTRSSVTIDNKKPAHV